MTFDRRTFITSLALGSCSALLAGRVRARQFTQGEGLHEVRRGVGIFLGPGGTIGYVATHDGAVIVDSQFPATARTFLEALRRRASPERVVLINTHHHGDHTAGNAVLRAAARQIVQHERCAASHRQLLQNADAGATAGVADVTFADRWSTDVGGEPVTAIFFGPAHTGGDAAVLFERAEVVHLGDLVFNRVPPFVDRPAGASIRSWIDVLETVLREYKGAVFVFGHAKYEAVTGTAADVARFRDYLSAVLDHVDRGITAGWSQDEITRLEVLPGFPDFTDAVKDYASPNPLFTLAHVLTAAYQELAAR